jgi:ABC-type multidrug transport system permease subunit
MVRYFHLQAKRIWKLFPFVCAVAVALLLGLGLTVYSALLEPLEEGSKFKIGLAGDTTGDYLQFGLATFQNLDSSGLSIEFVPMEEEAAKAALGRREISAYVVFPDDFIENALAGKMEPVKYVTTTGATGMVPMLKNEITSVITRLLVYSEKGTYGFNEAGKEVGMPYRDRLDQMDLYSLEYMELILSRADSYETVYLGAADGQSLLNYFAGGLSVTFLLLIGLPFASALIKKDYSLHRMLAAKGYSAKKQLLCEYLAHFSAMSVLALLIFGLLALLGGNFAADYFEAGALWQLLWQALPVVAMISAFNLLVFEAAGNSVGGILMHFLLTLSLCYISGCLYPLFSFPILIQKFAPLLPSGAARIWVSSCLGGAPQWAALLGSCLYGLLFFALALWVRQAKMQRRALQ